MNTTPAPTHLTIKAERVSAGPSMSRESALTERIHEVRASRDAAAWKATQAFLRNAEEAAREWAAMADEDNQLMNALNDELRTVREAQA